MGDITAGLYEKPSDAQECEYVLMDGKWYHKDIVAIMTRTEHYESMAATDLEPGVTEYRLGVDCVGDVTSDEKGSGARYNSGKPPMHYIPINQQLLVLTNYEMDDRLLEILLLVGRFERRAISMADVVKKLTIEDLIEASYVWDYGAKKYAPFNWMKGMAWSIPLACISRHAQAMAVHHELVDRESGCPHWAHLICNILMLQHYELFYTKGDDRPPAEMFHDC